MPNAPKRPRPSREATSERLLRAAAREFNEHGVGGTDTNRIARRAGFAPQTFYRWFEDKLDIFIKVYELWQREEFAAVDTLLAENADDSRLAHAVAAHHKAYLVFRRSLRQLSVENHVVRAARARSRLNQIAYVKGLSPNVVRDDASVAAMLLQTERLADALAEGEFHDMGLNDNAGEEGLARLIHDLLIRGSHGGEIHSGNVQPSPCQATLRRQTKSMRARIGVAIKGASAEPLAPQRQHQE